MPKIAKHFGLEARVTDARLVKHLSEDATYLKILFFFSSSASGSDAVSKLKWCEASMAQKNGN